MPITRTDRNETYRDGKLVDVVEVEVDVTAEVVEFDTHDKLRRWRANNREFLALPDPTAAESRAQVVKLTRQVNAMMRLLLRDLLTDETED